jgi:hypothetical protein
MKHLSLCVVLFSVLVFTACDNRPNDEKIIGTWEYESVEFTEGAVVDPMQDTIRAIVEESMKGMRMVFHPDGTCQGIYETENLNTRANWEFTDAKTLVLTDVNSGYKTTMTVEKISMGTMKIVTEDGSMVIEYTSK